MKYLLSIFLTLFYSQGFAKSSPSVELTTSESKNMHAVANRYFYSFGNQSIHYSQWTYFTLRNNGAEPLYIRGVFIIGSAFDAWTNCPINLPPQRSCLTRVEFRPWYVGFFSGQLRFAYTNDSTYVDLSGWGVDW